MWLELSKQERGENGEVRGSTSCMVEVSKKNNWWAKSGLPRVSVNKIWLEYRNTRLFTYCLWLFSHYNYNQSWVDIRKMAVLPTIKPKIFTIWFLLKKTTPKALKLRRGLGFISMLWCGSFQTCLQILWHSFLLELGFMSLYLESGSVTSEPRKYRRGNIVWVSGCRL